MVKGIVMVGNFLIDRPESLHVLWQEWESGLDGMVSVCLFTAKEWSKYRQKYSRQKVVWEKVREIIRIGNNHMTEIDMIYMSKGTDKSVT